MMRFLEIVHCPDCLDSLFEEIHEEEQDSVDQEVA
jgi:hypothetical protein